MLSKIDKQVIAAIQGDIPVCERPYEKLAQQIKLTEQQFCDHLQSLYDRNIIRRYGATLRHQKSGYTSNAMVAWIVEETNVMTVGQIMSDSPHISHCYRRNPTRDWPYNLYTMIHGNSDNDCIAIASSLSHKTQVKEYAILFSRRELKKTSMQYYPGLSGQLESNNPTT
ncbi:MAG: AsnC Family transcriptional regulator [Candidatus Magnetoglobus multicellularis str. Araruama]|uniref:siroheme decarboxylase n=1 Tax=Candidatus Magnetoglobus multicellularis str. Araruama TaxID=890399 RepID=A0A1V1P0V3_9BACT|nr:MAG: AsnC Family transcriptional regulator [Candidatus Magnetoglobus multicellularis str. Araruama]